MTVHWGPSVTVDARVVSVLMRHAGLDQFRQRNRGVDLEVDRTLEEMRQVAARHARSFVNATLQHLDETEAEALKSRESVTVVQAADLLKITPQAVRKACTEKRLIGRKVGRQWDIALEDLAAYKARKEMS